MTLEFLPKIVIAILTTAIITTIVQKILIVLIHKKIYCSVPNPGKHQHRTAAKVSLICKINVVIKRFLQLS